MAYEPELLIKPPLRCEGCPEKCLVVSPKANKNWYICMKSPAGWAVNAWKKCNDIKDCPLGKPNIII